MTSQWPRWHLKSPASRLFTQSFIQAQIKENIKAPRHWPLCGEFTGDRWIPRTKGQLRGKCFHLMTSSCAQWNQKILLSCLSWVFKCQSLEVMYAYITTKTNISGVIKTKISINYLRPLLSDVTNHLVLSLSSNVMSRHCINHNYDIYENVGRQAINCFASSVNWTFIGAAPTAYQHSYHSWSNRALPLKVSNS